MFSNASHPSRAKEPASATAAGEAQFGKECQEKAASRENPFRQVPDTCDKGGQAKPDAGGQSASNSRHNASAFQRDRQGGLEKGDPVAEGAGSSQKKPGMADETLDPKCVGKKEPNGTANAHKHTGTPHSQDEPAVGQPSDAGVAGTPSAAGTKHLSPTVV